MFDGKSNALRRSFLIRPDCRESGVKIAAKSSELLRHLR
jgi:hypothetical protein